MSAEEPTTAPAAEATNGHNESNDAAAIESTSNANEAAADPEVPALPPTDENDKEDTGKEVDLDMKAADTTEAASSATTVVAPTGDEAPSTAKKDTKRRASTGTPAKKLNKKKSMVTLQLDAKPGDYFWARLKGYPPWPAIICDDDMLPESLHQNRPVTAKRPDGSYRPDFEDGGKSVKDRTYPVMYLFTNEFSWMPNVDLRPLDIEELKNETSAKKSKQLWGAYQVAAEGHDLQHFKDVLATHEEELREDAAAAEAAAEEKAAKAAAKKSGKKSKASADEDTVMEDDEAAADEEEEEGGKKAKASKKRKKDAESEGEGAKPAKTPKTKTLKLSTGKASNGDTPTTGKKTKAKTAKSKEPKEAPKPEPTEAELKQKREKEVLYFRHKLQKGFLSSNDPPKESEMDTMAEYFNSLEQLDDLEQSVIRTTKIHKVLKAINKLANIPKDEEHNFKARSVALLAKWQKVLADGGEAGAEDGDKTEVVAAEDKKEDVEMEDVAKEEIADPKDEPAEAEPEAAYEPPAETAKEIEAEAKDAPVVEEAKTEAPAETPAAEKETTEVSTADTAAANNLI